MTYQEFLSRYSFDREKDRLGNGSFGTVYKAYDMVLDCWIALKISPVGPAGTRLRREVELVCGLPPHPNVARYEECYTFDGPGGTFDVAVLSYYPEGSLAELIASGDNSPELMADILIRILEGLKFLHAHNVAHRDLKPANILIAKRPDGSIVPKITDFGISRQSDPDETVADETVTATATVSYASPEQLSGSGMTVASDIWSFGVIAYLVAAGEMPFTSGEHAPKSLMGRAEIVRQVTSGKLPEKTASLPYPWQAIIRRCLVSDPRERTVTEDELITLLRQVPASGGFMPSALPAPPAPPTPSASPSTPPALKGRNYVPKPDIDVPNVKQKSNVELKIIIVLLIVALGILILFLAGTWRRSSSVPQVAPERRSLKDRIERYERQESQVPAVDTFSVFRSGRIDTASTSSAVEEQLPVENTSVVSPEETVAAEADTVDYFD